LIIVQDELLGLEKLGKLMLEEQRRVVHFGGLGENEVLLIRTKNFKCRTRNFTSGIENFKGSIGNFKGEEPFLKQNKENFGKGRSDVFNSMNKSGHNNRDEGKYI
jgi:hypothetical protein